MLNISNNAQKYLIKLLKQQKQGTQIRIFIKKMHKNYPEYGICYFFPKENNPNDIIIKFDVFSVYLNQTIAPLIKGTTIDLICNQTEKYLKISPPNLNTVPHNNNNQTTEFLSLTKKIKNIIDLQINPQLSIHGGSISLIKITNDFHAVIQFNGGCNGCSMALYTIKEGIEKTLKKFFPELKGVIDSTQHQRGNHSYY